MNHTFSIHSPVSGIWWNHWHLCRNEHKYTLNPNQSKNILNLPYTGVKMLQGRVEIAVFNYGAIHHSQGCICFQKMTAAGELPPHPCCGSHMVQTNGKEHRQLIQSALFEAQKVSSEEISHHVQICPFSS